MERQAWMFYKNDHWVRDFHIVIYKMIKIIKETDYFGEIGIMENKLWSATIIANENVELAVISWDDFLIVLETA